MADNQPTTNLPGEEWKPVVGWEDYYSVSNLGRVRSEARISTSCTPPRKFQGKILKLAPKDTGHLQVGLYRNGKGYARKVHRLVAEAFLGSQPDLEVCHIDGNPQNNHVDNLSYGTRSQNTLDAVLHGTHNNARKTHCVRGHVLSMPNLMKSLWEKRGGRACLACNRAGAHISYHKHLKGKRKELSDSYYQQIMKDAA